MRPRKAVIDVGSNSVLLLVAEHVDSFWVPIREASYVTALGAGTKQSGLLAEPNLSATLDAIAEAFGIARSLGAESIEALATMAARIATNAPDFLARAEAQGTPVSILSGDQEAELGFLAVANDPEFASEARISIIDVGGQSTELVTAQRTATGWNTNFRKSFSIGTLALRGSALGESPNPGEILFASSAIDDVIGLNYSPGEAGKAIALGATGTNLVTIRDRMETWDPKRVHGSWLDYEEVSKAVDWMMPMTDAQRREIIGMEPGREKSLPTGALILERFLNAIGAGGCAVSVRGWRHAVLEQA